jgi:hypothetical protein
MIAGLEKLESRYTRKVKMTLDKFAEAIEAVGLEFDRTPLVEDCSNDSDDEEQVCRRWEPLSLLTARLF